MAIKGPNGQEIDPAEMNFTTMDTLPPDAATEAPMIDDPGSEAQEPDMPPPDDPIV